MQVHADFEYIGAACGIKTLCLYGGAQYGPQEYTLRKGVDVVVGTPGRVKDHLERTTLNLVNVKYGFFALFLQKSLAWVPDPHTSMNAPAPQMQDCSVVH